MTNEYRADEFIYFLEEKTGEYEKVRGKNNSIRKHPITNKIIIDFDKIDDLDLEKRGEQVPFSHKHVVNTPLYMLYYWSPVIGDRACWLYLQLLTYCRDDKDFLWDKLDEIAYRMKLTRPTLNKLLNVLEENNFIIKIHRLNKLDNSRQTTPLIKVRQTIPLLSESQYQMLSENGKKQHDRFMARYGKHSNMDEISYDPAETMNELTANGKVKLSKKMKAKMEEMLHTEKLFNFIESKLSEQEKYIVEKFHSLLVNDYSMHFSKPSYDTFFKDSFIFYNEKWKSIELVVSEYTKEVLENSLNQSYEPKLMMLAKELFPSEQIVNIVYYTFEEYITKKDKWS